MVWLYYINLDLNYKMHLGMLASKEKFSASSFLWLTCRLVSTKNVCQWCISERSIEIVCSHCSIWFCSHCLHKLRAVGHGLDLGKGYSRLDQGSALARLLVMWFRVMVNWLVHRQAHLASVNWIGTCYLDCIKCIRCDDVVHLLCLGSFILFIVLVYLGLHMQVTNLTYLRSYP